MTSQPRIRAEQPADIEPVFRITEAAFRGHPYSQGTEPFIIDALREAGALTLSLVAEVDGEVVGHVAFSPVQVSDGASGWYALGPVSVLPARQKRGIGSALVRGGLAELQRRGAKGCVLVGEPGFYHRFGFESRPDLSMEGIPQPYVLSLPFGAEVASGRISHHEAFHARRIEPSS
jgi:putative acetyltransferase